jgi:molybdate transport system substrate-binding protein
MSFARVVVQKLIILFVVLILVGCSQDSISKQEITVSAAASLKDALSEIKEVYIKENNNQVVVHLNVASSGTLSMQIEQGAPTDIFLSASEIHFKKLIDQKLINTDTQVALLKNRMVLIAPIDNENIKNVEDLTDEKVERIALGIPEIVPAGKYGKEALVYFDIWDQLKDKIVPTKDVRQVLTYVETGNVDAGFVYQTDALLSDKVKVVKVFDETMHAPIVYPAGIVESSTSVKEARAFYKFLQSEKAMRIFEKYGFDVMD